MAGQSQDTGGVIAGINVTPLVDVMLVLLVIFMVTAKLVVQPPKALPVDLPQASAGNTVSFVFAITVLSDGSLRLDGAPVSDDASFVAQARAEHAAHPDLKAVIAADAHVLHERVVHVMDLLGQAGITQTAFAVQVPTVADTPR